MCLLKSKQILRSFKISIYIIYYHISVSVNFINISIWLSAINLLSQYYYLIFKNYASIQSTSLLWTQLMSICRNILTKSIDRLLVFCLLDNKLEISFKLKKYIKYININNLVYKITIK